MMRMHDMLYFYVMFVLYFVIITNITNKIYIFKINNADISQYHYHNL